MLLGVLVPLLSSASGAPDPPRRPPVDVVAMREAMGGYEGTQYPAAASYAHFLAAQLAHHAGQHHRALDELRLALATDEASSHLRIALAKEHAVLGEAPRAEAQLIAAISRRPNDASAHLVLGRLLVGSGKLDRARTHIERAIRLAPRTAESYLLLADLALKRGMTDRAIEIIDRLGRALPEEPLGFRRLGLFLAEKGDGARAERLLKKAVERDPADLESWATLGHIYESTARLGQALAAWERAAQCDPENAEVLFAAGRVALRLGRPDDARATFDRLLTRAGDPETSIRVALSYLAGRQPERALEVLDRVRRASSEPRIEYLAGIVSERLGRLETAAEAFERVAQDEGDLARQARLHLASCLSGLGRHQSALGEFERLAAQSPELPGLRVPYARALERSGQASRAEAELVRELDRTASSEVAEALTQFYRRQGRLDEAVRQLRAARTRRPEDHELRLALAVALDKSGDWHSAIDELRAHTSDSPAAANFVGYSLASRGLELQLATRLVQKALSAEPEDSAFLDSMGWVWLKRGDPRRALRYLLKALDAAPEEPTLLEHLGEVLSRLGRRGEARVFFRRAAEQLDLNPDAAERPGQRAEIDERLKALEASAR